ncbi:MAG TPA: 4Fe-4S dicluster domain-containing protein [Planctomycetota bacterium]|nr:4Fe-4S dicluster domain-containing protein [Planctomycetota bacterium]
MIDQLRRRARELLTTGEAACIIGYANASVPGKAAPIVITRAEDADRLVFHAACCNNLAVYLTRPEIRKLGTVAMVAKPADVRAAFVLMQENQVRPDDVKFIAVDVTPAGECTLLAQRTREELLDYLVKNVPPAELADDALKDVAALEEQTDGERWAYWQQQFSRCIRCYACRQVCPLCYCSRCVADKNRPQWIETSAHGRGNLAWNITRAFHLAGRCVGCGECERACPAGIPLMKLNRKLAKDVRDSFGVHAAGYAFSGEQLFAGYSPSDPNDFFE